MRNTLLNVEAVIGQFSLRPRGCSREFRLGQEMERRGRGCFEVQPLHRPHAAIGEVGQEHERHGGSVTIESTVVLPKCPTAAVFSGDVLHHVHDAEELGVSIFTFKPGVVPPCPIIDDCSLKINSSPAVHRGGRTIGVGHERTTRQHSKGSKQPEDEDDNDHGGANDSNHDWLFSTMRHVLNGQRNRPDNQG
ncbi:unannotated protein [freshwater metagenome]|uniref:Unannotated protein n=1 Tax=freshwater metagenome TaxID=449393 RepID=A0A6J7USV4_9ZZZZ